MRSGAVPAAITLVLTFAAGCGGSGPRRAAIGPTATVAHARSAHFPHHRRRPHAHQHRRTPSPGTLPQTSRLPSANTAAFHAEMGALWRGVRGGSVRPAMPSFFPEAAYAQVKAIGDPAADWTERLVGDYALDIAAAHGLLGAGAPQARLVVVNVPGADAHWVPPGACYNGVGYYEVPDARLVYRERGALSSFGIASMISWRGRWYVVHLGAVSRSAAEGIVDDPESGEGASVPSSTC